MSSTEFRKRPYKFKNFVASTSFDEGEGSFYKCLSFGILEIIIRFMEYGKYSMILKTKLLNDLKALERKQKKYKVKLNLLNILREIFQIIRQAPNTTTGLKWLNDNSKNNGQVCESFEKIMKSLIALIAVNIPKIHDYLFTSHTSGNYFEILEIIADHFGLCIKFVRNRGTNTFFSKSEEFSPILYIYQCNFNFMILYTQEAVNIENGKYDENTFRSSNLIYRNEEHPNQKLIQLPHLKDCFDNTNNQESKHHLIKNFATKKKNFQGSKTTTDLLETKKISNQEIIEEQKIPLNYSNSIILPKLIINSLETNPKDSQILFSEIQKWIF